MSQPTAVRRTRRAALVAGLVATLLAGPGLVTPANAAAPDAGACRYGGYTGDARISFDGAPQVGVGVTATLVPGGDWTDGARAEVTWSGTGYGDPVRGATFTPRYDLVGADTHATVRVTHGGSAFTARCDLPDVAWGEISRPAAPRLTGRAEVGEVLHATAGDGDVLPAHARYHFEWFSGDSTSAFATGTDVRVTAALAGHPVVVKAMITAWGHEESAWSPATTSDTVALETLARPGVPTVSGQPIVGGMLSAAPAASDSYPDGAAYSYAWYSAGVEFATSRDVVLGPDQVGRRITVRTSVHADGYADSPWSPESAPTDPVSAAVLATPSALSISGTPAVGATLTAVTTGSWSPGTSVSYTWRASGVPVGSGPTLTLTAAQLGATITVEATGTQDGYASRTLVSDPVGPVAPATDEALPGVPGAPTISGTPQVGRTLTATPAGSDAQWPAGATYHFEWYAGATLVGTGSQLTLQGAQVGRSITVRTRVTAPGYLDSDWSALSTPTAVVTAGDLEAPTGVTITGRARVGKTLTVRTDGSWADGATVTYRWLADGIPFASGARATLRAQQRGTRITVEVTGTAAGYDPVTLTSDPTRTVAAGRLTTSRPVLRGQVVVGHTLRVGTGAWTPGTRLTYTWFAGGHVVRGATGDTLDLTRRFEGERIRVQVTGHLAGYRTATERSGPTSAVRGPGRPHHRDARLGTEG